jgi:outer membrane protein OmpA-like peptidoglycan-associated protein
MKQSMISLGTALVALTLVTGCGKKKSIQVEKTMEMTKESVAPENSYVFDDNIENADQFAFGDTEGDSTLKRVEQYPTEPGMDDEFALLEDGDERAHFNKVHFDFNSDKIRNDQQEAMHKNIEKAKEAVAQGKNVEVRAYRCQMGDPVYNVALSQRSANNIKKEMVAHGVPENKIIALGCGQEKPLVASNALDRSTRIEQLSPNRRVEIVAH